MPIRPGEPCIRRFAGVLLVLACVRYGDPAPAPGRSAPEYSIKAAYLYNFVRYVTWPAEAFASRESPIVVGVLGKDPFGSGIDKVFEGRSVLERRIEVRRVTLKEAAARCHVVFIGSENRALLAHWLGTLRAKPVLSVTESPDALSAGAAVNFVMEGSRLKYEVNMGIVEESRLEIAAPMLVSARRVLGGSREGPEPPGRAR